MIAHEAFHQMLRLAAEAGTAHRPMPDLGYLSAATKDQMRVLNETYDEARNRAAAARYRRWKP